MQRICVLDSYMSTNIVNIVNVVKTSVRKLTSRIDMAPDDRHLKFPSIDMRYNDSFFVAEEIRKLKDNQKKLEKENKVMQENQAEFAGELLQVEECLLKERENHAANMTKANEEIQKLTAEIDLLKERVNELASQKSPTLSSERNVGDASNGLKSKSNDQAIRASSIFDMLLQLEF